MKAGGISREIDAILLLKPCNSFQIIFFIVLDCQSKTKYNLVVVYVF